MIHWLRLHKTFRSLQHFDRLQLQTFTLLSQRTANICASSTTATERNAHQNEHAPTSATHHESYQNSQAQHVKPPADAQHAFADVGFSGDVFASVKLVG
jgi:hypothetical protein